MTVLRGAAWACALVAGSLVVAGCTPDEPEPTPTTPVETNTTSSAPETSEPTVAAPEMPAEAMQASAAGAQAWVTHWFDLVNYAKATGDTQPLKTFSGSACKVCASTASDIDSNYADGGHMEGGEATVLSVLSPPPDSRNLVAVATTFTEAAATVVRANGSREPRNATPETRIDFVMVHEGGQWALREIGTP